MKTTIKLPPLDVPGYSSSGGEVNFKELGKASLCAWEDPVGESFLAMAKQVATKEDRMVENYLKQVEGLKWYDAKRMIYHSREAEFERRFGA